MTFGNTPIDGGKLLLTRGERDALIHENMLVEKFVRPIRGAAEFIRGVERFCIWVEDNELDEASKIPQLVERFDAVRQIRLNGGTTAQYISGKSHQFQRMITATGSSIIIPVTTSENREYLPVGILGADTVVLNTANAIYDAPIWNMSLIASKLMLSWIATVCIRMRTDYRFTPTLGWNTFPVPKLTEKNKADLTRCAEDILLAREAHFPATIADLYKPDAMPQNLRDAHDRNDETLERIYIGRRFKNDTERLEKLFEMYTKITTKVPA